MITKNNGIALIQVLLITAILTVFALFFTKTAKNQVEMAGWSNDRALAEVTLHSAMNEVLFTLLTNEKEHIKSSESGSDITEKWNFYGKPFLLNESVTVEIQDQSGLLGIHGLDKELFVKFLSSNGIKTSRAELVADRLLDWQDVDSIQRPLGLESESGSEHRNANVPDLTDIENAVDLTDKEKKLIYENTTIYFNGALNPLTASEELINTFTDELSAKLFVNQREQFEQITKRDFERLSPLVFTDNMQFVPSNNLSLKFIAKINDVVITKYVVISLSRYAVGTALPIFIMLEKS